MTTPNLRPAQAKILAYNGGKMAVSAVPGSGKTFTLTRLAGQLITEGEIDTAARQEVLIVTYLNSSADTFKSRLREYLTEHGFPPIGYDARTLHSLSYEIVRLMHGDSQTAPQAIDDAQARANLSRAIDQWRDLHVDLWNAFIPTDTPDPNVKARWRSAVEAAAKTFIKTAKNEQATPTVLYEKLSAMPEAESPEWAFTRMLIGIYDQYQTQLFRSGVLDFDDQILEAVNFVQNNPDLATSLQNRWPYILEDEAQDSVPLQAVLLKLLTSKTNNLVRVGDPNQAITSTFTAARPKFFLDFLATDGVNSLPLPNSGRNAPIIYTLANHLIIWTQTHHPLTEVRTHTFRTQSIEPTPEGDSQPNPPDSDANIVITEFNNRERHEIPHTIDLARRYALKFPTRTTAILVPTNYLGNQISDILDAQKIPYDNLLRGGYRERIVASCVYGVLALMTNPTKPSLLWETYSALREIQHPAANGELEDDDRFEAILKGCHRPEQFIYPRTPDDILLSLPKNVVGETDLREAEKLSGFLRHVFRYRQLDIESLMLSLADDLFLHDTNENIARDIATSYQLAVKMRQWKDLEPELRLPDIAAKAKEVADGRLTISTGESDDTGFEPKPGRITLITQHRAKGMEWDAVFLLGMDRHWIPSDLEDYFQGVNDMLGGDPSAIATIQLKHLLHLQSETADLDGLYEGLSATESAHIDVMSERLRLLYVSITRARRFLQISYSKTLQIGRNEREAEPAEAILALARYLDTYKLNNPNFK